ncbi:unnamed protein product [Pleuronectes platessa]|uniref:Uncharacterized protein n=1 Tax=Pleuronectes platessa TaxID=8262 RepID=A0A9N7YNK6_PLEPL|nr:unnamed protein product [Pleuronectes platessa]
MPVLGPTATENSAPQILNSDLPIGLRPLALLEGGSHLQEAPPHSLAENRDTFPAIHGQSGDGCSFLQTGKDLAKENEKNSLRFGPAPSRRRPQRLRDQRPEARTSSTSSFRDSRYYGRARNPAKQHEADLTEDVHLLKDTSHVAGLPASLCDRL